MEHLSKRERVISLPIHVMKKNQQKKRSTKKVK